MGDILLTGGAGFIGSHTAVELLASGENVIVLDDLSNSKESVVERIERIAGKRVRFLQGGCRRRGCDDARIR